MPSHVSKVSRALARNCNRRLTCCMVRAVRLLLAIALLSVTATTARADASGDDGVRTTLEKHGAQIRRCYERGLRSEPDLGRKLVVRFRVDGAGRARRVQFVSRESTIHHDGVERCVAKVFRSMRFRRVPADWYRSPLIFSRG